MMSKKKQMIDQLEQYERMIDQLEQDKRMIDQLEQDKRMLRDQLTETRLTCCYKDEELEKLRISLNDERAEFNEKCAKLLERYIAMMERTAGIDEKAKQIEEMARIACDATNPEIERDCAECPFDMMCDIQNSCEALYDAGYRKQSEGEWEQQLRPYEDEIKCTACGAIFNIIDNCTEKFNHCPNCGAKMKGEKQ